MIHVYIQYYLTCYPHLYQDQDPFAFVHESANQSEPNSWSWMYSIKEDVTTWRVSAIVSYTFLVNGITCLPHHIRYTKQLIKWLQIVVFQVYNKKSVCLDTISLGRSVYLQMQVVVHRSTAQRSRQQSQCHSKCLYISQEMLPRWGDVPMYICISNYIISQSLLILTRVKRAMVINLASKSLKCSCDVSE